MRLILVLLTSFIAATASCQKYSFFDKEGNEVATKEESYYYEQIISKDNSKCTILQFYSYDDSKKMEAEGMEVMTRDFNSLSNLGNTYVFEGPQTNYHEGGDPWYVVIWGGRKNPAYGQYWVDGLPQLVHGSGTVRLLDESWNVVVAGFKDSVMVIHYEVDGQTKDTTYVIAEEHAFVTEGDDKLQDAFDSAMLAINKVDESRGAMIFVRFVVDKSGAVSDVKVDDGVDEMITAWIEKNFSTLAKWNPAIFKGKPVKSEATFGFFRF